MPRPSAPFSVPDPLGDAWDEMVRRNRLLQARNDPYSGALESSTDDGDVSTALNQAQMPITAWQALRAQQLAEPPPSDINPPAAEGDAVSGGGSDTDLLQGGAGADTVSAPDSSSQIPSTGSGASTASNRSPTASPKHDNTNFYQMGAQWLTGLGPRHHDFGPDDPATQILRQHDHIQGIRDKIAASPPPVGLANDGSYSLKGWQGIPEFLKDYSAVPTGGATGNLAAAYLGSYPLKYTVKGIGKDGVATVDFDASNTSSLASALHIPVAGYTPTAIHHLDPVINGLVPRGPGSLTTQRFQWTERIPTHPGVSGTKRVR